MKREPKIQIRLADFVDEFSQALKEQVLEDEKRWGNTWLERPKKGQEERIYNEYERYYRDFKEKGTPIPWLKIAGNSLIAWLRENKNLSDKW